MTESALEHLPARCTLDEIRSHFQWLADGHASGIVGYVTAKNYLDDVRMLLDALDALTYAYHAYETSPATFSVGSLKPGDLRTRLTPAARADALDTLLSLLGELESGTLYQALTAYAKLAGEGA